MEMETQQDTNRLTWERYTLYMNPQMINRIKIHARNRRMTIKETVHSALCYYFSTIDKKPQKSETRQGRETSKAYHKSISVRINSSDYYILKFQADKLGNLWGRPVSINEVIRIVIDQLVDEVLGIDAG